MNNNEKHIANLKNELLNYEANVSELYKGWNTTVGHTDENEIIFAGINRAKYNMHEFIENECDKAIAELEAEYALAGSQITEDAKLLDADILTNEELIKLADKYKNNATMTRLIKDYDEKKARECAKAGRLWRSPDFKPSKEEKASAWNAIRNRCIVITDSIATNAPRNNIIPFRLSIEDMDKAPAFVTVTL